MGVRGADQQGRSQKGISKGATLLHSPFDPVWRTFAQPLRLCPDPHKAVVAASRLTARRPAGDVLRNARDLLDLVAHASDAIEGTQRILQR